MDAAAGHKKEYLIPKKNNGIYNDGTAHIVEFYYDAVELLRADGKPLADIVRLIQQSLYSGEYKDITRLAKREEVYAEQIKFHRAAPQSMFYSNAEHAVRGLEYYRL